MAYFFLIVLVYVQYMYSFNRYTTTVQTVVHKVLLMCSLHFQIRLDKYSVRACLFGNYGILFGPPPPPFSDRYGSLRNGKATAEGSQRTKK